MEKKNIPKEKDEVKEILEAQAIVDKIIAAKADAIKRIDQEIKELKGNKTKQKPPNDPIDKGINVGVLNTVKKKCRNFKVTSDGCIFYRAALSCILVLDARNCYCD